MEDVNFSYNAELQPGTILCGGKYTIEKKIGQGGFGITYKAIQSGLGRTVCIKEYYVESKCMRNTQTNMVLVSGINSNIFEKYRKAFVQEAQTLAQLHHQGIVEVVDVFDENNTSYMVMSFIEGRSLQSIVEKNGPLSYDEAVNYIAQVTNAVGYIHTRNILHRDIKPDNIMVTADKKAILIDFGSARKFEHDKTQAQTSILTKGYAPVEQYNANSRKGSYTDIYAIGATLYFLVTGQQPMDALERYSEQMPEPRELNPNIPIEGNRTILKAMQIKAENRHQTVQDFMDDLCGKKPSVLVDETIGGGAPIQPNNGGSNKKPWIAILAVAFVVIVGLVFFLAQGGNNESGYKSPDPEYKGPDPEYKGPDSEKIEDFRRDYEETLTRLEKFRLPKILKGEDGCSPGVTSCVIDALTDLATIEKKENDPIFSETGLQPVYNKDFSVFKNNLNEAIKELEKMIENMEYEGHGSDYGPYDHMKEWLEKDRKIMELSKQGSAISAKSNYFNK